MKAILAALLLLCPWGYLQALTPPATLSSSGTAAREGAFTLVIDAPEAVRELLQRNLDVLRYQGLSDLSDSELARLLLAAEQDARELVATLGYFSPTITIDPPVNRDGNFNAHVARALKLSVVPGEPTEVSDVKLVFTGPILAEAGAEQRERVIREWALETGMRFSQTRWTDAKQQAVLQLTAQNYPTASLTHSEADIDPVTQRARLSVTLDSGPRYRLGPLVITGLNHFSSDIVRRLVRLPMGDYDQTQLVAAQQRLTDSGYFDSAFISIDTSGDPAAAPVLVQVREAKLQKLVLGIGASTDTGARLSIEHTHHKLPLLDWRAVNKLLLARDTTSLASEVTSHPNDDNWRWSLAGVIQQQTLGSFLIHSQSLRVGRARSTEPLDNEYYLQLDRADAATSDATAQAEVQSLTANYAFTIRRFDHPLFPNSGWGLGLALGAGTTVGARNDPYGRIVARWLSYQPLGGAGVASSGRLALRAQAGAVVAEAGAYLPSTQIFFIGGDNSVRGYAYRELGVTLPDGQTTGGRTMALGSVEWQRPIRINGRASDWESTVFIDAGAVANSAADLRPKVGVGIGARWKSPVGPLQIDVAYGVDVQRLRLHLNVGFNF
ncbi:MAG: outer membrane protein assembly factor [Burkholderiales bacterium PBB3]|nr:MAG: outer membrane protein assembly factor [Burkholderiales bacterium PBB3]